MTRRYSVVLGVLSLTLAAVALGTIQLEAAVSRDLIPFYMSGQFTERDTMEFQRLQQLSYALDDFGMWAILAATVPAIVILIISMVSTRRVSR